MSALRIISCLASLVFCCFILCSDISKIDVYAEGEHQQTTSLPVELTSAQTLALYGSSIPALYYDGASVRSTTFEFYKSSKSLATDVERVFNSGFYGSTDPSNLFAFGRSSYDQRYWCQEWVATVNQGTWLNSNSGWLLCDALQPYEFLIYRAPVALSSVNQSDADFQINLDFSIALDGVERFCAINAYSIDFVSSFDLYALPSISHSNLRSTLKYFDSSSSVIPFGITSDCYNNDYSFTSFGAAFHPVALPSLTNIGENQWDYWTDMYKLFPSPVFSMCYFDSGLLNSSVSLSSMYWDIFASAGGITHEDGYRLSDPTFTTQYTYLMLMCPVVWGDVSQPEPEPGNPDYSDSINNIVSGVGVTNTKLDLILQKLDRIYETEININNNISSIGTKIDNISTSILTGLQNLFIPSQTDLINFRLNMQSDFQNHFPAFFTADDKVHNLYSVFQGSVFARSQIHVPLIHLSCPDVSNNKTASFEFGGYDVDLKPNSDKIGILYDSLAIIIDIIATLGILNMLRSRFRRIIGGGDIE